ncbi:hypothetical protein DFAR_2870022 [Desulfarculales bacterium]
MESSSTTATTGGPRVSQKPDPEVSNSCDQTTASSLPSPWSPSALIWRPKIIMQTAEVLAVAKRSEYAIRLGALALVTGDVGSGKSTALR